MNAHVRWSWLAGIALIAGLTGVTQAGDFTTVLILGEVTGTTTGQRPAWSSSFDPAAGRSISMSEIGDPVLLMLDKRVAAAQAREQALADAAIQADATAQAEPALPELAELEAVELPEPEAVIVVGIRPPGYRSEAPWSYHPRSQAYSGTRAPRYYQTPRPRYYSTQRPRYYTRRPERPWGHEAGREVYGYTIRQLRDMQEQLSAQLEAFEAQAGETPAGAVSSERVARRWANRRY